MSHISEMLFVDPSVACVDTILSGLRPGVAAVLLDPAQPAACQIASALKGQHGLDAVHVVAHGAPGRVCFTSGDWSAPTLEEQRDDLAAIGQALTEDGGLRLWSCDAGAGAAGTAFIEVLAGATGANVAAATGRIGAATRGGNWELTAPSARPPLTAAGIADYPGVLATNTWIGGGLPNATDWYQANNWSLGSVPTSTDDVVIDSGGPNPIIPNGVSINSLTLNVPWGGGINVLGSIVSNASLYSYSASSISASGGITNNGSIGNINLSGGSITNNGPITGGPISDSILSSSGDIINNATGQITNCRLTNSGNIINNGSIIGSLTGFISSSGYLTNNGTISHAYLGISGGISNSGLITDCQPGIAADGSYQVSSGDITNNATERSQTRFF